MKRSLLAWSSGRLGPGATEFSSWDPIWNQSRLILKCFGLFLYSEVYRAQHQMCVMYIQLLSYYVYSRYIMYLLLHTCDIVEGYCLGGLISQAFNARQLLVKLCVFSRKTRLLNGCYNEAMGYYLRVTYIYRLPMIWLLYWSHTLQVHGGGLYGYCLWG